MNPTVSPPSGTAPVRKRGLSFRARLVFGVCGLVLLTGSAAHRSTRSSTEALTGSVFREVSGHAVTHIRGEVGEGDLPLGVMDDTVYREQTSAPFRPGQILFIGTDGVWEMPDVKGEQFGKERLRAVIRESAAGSADDITRAVREHLTAFRGDAKSVDDVTFVVVKVCAAETK